MAMLASSPANNTQRELTLGRVPTVVGLNLIDMGHMAKS